MSLMDTPREALESVPLPSYRHAMPSGPWPWMDIGSKESDGQTSALTCDHPNCDDCSKWLNYPQSLFPNWTCDQVERSGMLVKSGQQDHCQIYFVDINGNGKFDPPREIDDSQELWEFLRTEVRR